MWEKSNPVMQKQQIFRARCAFCKAEFCKEDIVLLPKLIGAAPVVLDTNPAIILSSRKKSAKKKT